MTRVPLRALRMIFWTTSLWACGQYQPALEPPAVDDVADQVEMLALVPLQEIEQQFGLAAARAEMDVRQEDRAEVLRRGRVQHSVTMQFEIYRMLADSKDGSVTGAAPTRTGSGPRKR